MRFIRNPALPNPTAAPHLMAIPYGFTRTVPTSIISRKWWRLPRNVWKEGSPLYKRFFGDPDTGDRGYAGTVNSTPILGYPQGTLLLLAPEEEILPDSALNEDVVNLTLKWLYNSNGHNWFYWNDPNPSAATNGLYFVGRGDTFYTSDTLPEDYSIFNTRDHKNLFKVGELPT